MKRFAGLLFAVQLLAQSGEELLAKVDKLRHPWPAFTVEIQLKDKKAQQRWKVIALDNGDSRVEGLSEKEKGRAVLVLGDEMWLLLPNAKRPVRVTPQQRLFGPAAGGDIARSRFSEDYAVKAKAEDTLEGQACWRLDMEARRPSISFRTAKLWVSHTGTPLKGEFMLPSGKLAKTVHFGEPTMAWGLKVLSNMEITEPNGASAELIFSQWAPTTPDPALFQLPKADH